MDALVQRLVHNPHDQEAIAYAHHAGQNDPKSYAMLLEKVGTATPDPAFASHWLTEAANVWSSTLGDAHRAARALMTAIDRDPSQPAAADRLADLYREKGDTRGLVALLEKRAKALAPLIGQDPGIQGQLAGLHEELGRLWNEPPLSQPQRSIDNFRRAIELDSSSQYAIYSLREIYKSVGQWADAIPLFGMEIQLSDDPARQAALYQDESDARRNAGDLSGATLAARHARSLEGGQDAALKQLVAGLVLERVQARQSVAADEVREGAALFVELAEEYSGEHGFSYSACALEIEPGNDRAIQLLLYYGEQLGRLAEAGVPAARYLEANPRGAMAADARQHATEVPAQQAAPAARSAPRAAAAPAPAEVTGELEPDAMDEDSPEPPPAAVADPARVRQLLDEAEALVRKARKNDAATKYKDVLALEAANDEAIAFLEGHLRQGRKYGELRDMLVAATRVGGIDVERKKGWWREVAGLCETQLRDVDTALQAWKQLASLDRSDEGPRQQLRRILEKAQRWDELATQYEQEAEQETDVEARISLEKQLAKLHETKRKDPVATGEAWARIASLSPDDDEALQTAVKWFEKGARPELAAQAISDNVGSVRDEAVRIELLSKLGAMREAAGEHGAAGEAFSEAATLKKAPQAWQAAERCFVAAESWEQAANAAGERAALAGSPKEQAALHAKEADYLIRAGDEASAVMRLEQATDLDPASDAYAQALEERYVSAARHEDLSTYLLRRAEKLSDRALRVGLRRRAAELQRGELGNPDAARESLQLVLADGDDEAALRTLADDAQERGEPAEAVDYLKRLGRVIGDPTERVTVALREAELVADGMDDAEGAIERYEALLKELDPKNLEALRKIAELSEKRDDARGTAGALERQLLLVTEPAEKLEIAGRLAGLYEGSLDDPKAAIKALEIVRATDDEDFDAVQRLCELSERVEDWAAVARYTSQLIEVEGDEEEVSRMTRRLAEVLKDKVGKGDEALAALGEVADRGDEPCREEYVALGDELGWKGVVATKLVEWYQEAPVGPLRSEKLRAAFERFVEVGRDADAAGVGCELARTRAADAELAERLEQIAVRLKDLDTLGVAHDLLVQDKTGPSRAEEMVRQAEVLVQAGVEPEEAIQHGEQALSSVTPSDVEPLLERLSKLVTAPGHVIDLYERQVTRCKAPVDRLRALARAAQVAAQHGSLERARGFFDIALGGGAQEETLETLERVATEADEAAGQKELRRTLAQALASGGQGARDGGRTRSALLRRAARLAHAELGDVDQAFAWLSESLVSFVDDASLDALEELARDVGEPKRAEAAIGKALEEVFDGPLVRKLLARRASLRREVLGDREGAAVDLKRLHDLSPSDTAVMESLAALYTELGDFRGMVQLYEDQILRGKDQGARAEVARKVARLWEEQLGDAREAADAWRRVLRMKAGDPEATEGLERAKAALINKPKSIAPPPAAPIVAPVESPPAVSDEPAGGDDVADTGGVAAAPPEPVAEPQQADDASDDDQPTNPPTVAEAEGVAEAEAALAGLAPLTDADHDDRTVVTQAPAEVMAVASGQAEPDADAEEMGDEVVDDSELIDS